MRGRGVDRLITRMHDSSQSVVSSAHYVSVEPYCWKSIKLVFDSFRLEATKKSMVHSAELT